MRRKDRLVTDIDVLHRVIRKAHVCRLALVDDDKPYVVPMNFGFDGTFLYLHAAREGRKLDILRKNNRVCVEFEQDVELVPGKKPCDYGFRYVTVICHGYAEFVDALEEKRWALHHIITQYEPEWQPHNFKEWEMSSVVIIKITIDEMTGKSSGVTLE